MRFFRPGFLACLYPAAKFRIKTTEKILYLTFDDGPDPESTPYLLGILKKHKLNALFFCIGRKADAHPELIKQILADGHQTGNHSYNHIDGWKTNTGKYVNDVLNGMKSVSTKLFRPPFGRLKPKQYRILKNEFLIVFWDIMAYDFDSSFGEENSLNILKSKIRPGSIIVLHDTPKSTVSLFLDEFLTFATGEGYRFEMLDSYAKNKAASANTFSNM